MRLPLDLVHLYRANFVCGSCQQTSLKQVETSQRPYLADMPMTRTSELLNDTARRPVSIVLIAFTPCQKASLQTVRVSCCRVSLAAISIWGRCGACGDESGFPDSTVVKMKSEVGFPSSINDNASGDPIAALDRRRDVSDALYSEGSFVDNST